MTTLVKPWMIDAGPLVGFRNKIINGDFLFWGYDASQTSNGFGSDNRWYNSHIGSTKTHSRQSFTLGQTDVPGNPKFYSRTVVTSSAGAGNLVRKFQRIEGVETFAGEKATLTFWAKADAAKNIAVEFSQVFGSGGSPSAVVDSIGVTTCALTTSWKMFSFVVDIPPISDKTLGTDGNDSLQLMFWFDAGSDFDGRTNSLGQQSGTFELAHISLVPGDAVEEAKQGDVFEQRHRQQEKALCLRYYQELVGLQDYARHMNTVPDGSTATVRTYLLPITMRADPTPTILTVSYDNAKNMSVTRSSYELISVLIQGTGGVNLNGYTANIGLDAEL